MRARRSRAAAWAGLALCVGGCALRPGFWRPEGGGGWTAARRSEELGRIAGRAGVSFTAEAPARAAPSPRPRPLDLAAALALAAEGNRRIALSDRQVAAAAEQVRDARGRLLPATVASGRYTAYTDAQRNRVQFPAAGPAQGAPPASIRIRDPELATLNGTMTLPLDLSGELRHALAAAQAGYRGERARLWAVTLDQQLAVVRAYFQLLEAERLREVTEQNLALYHTQLAHAEAKFRGGRLTKNELLVVQVALQQAEEERQQRDLTVARARWALNQTIGVDVNAPTEPADVAERPQVPAVEEALRAAYDENPLLRSLVEERQRLDETLRSLERSRLPRLSAGGGIDYSSSDLLEPRDMGSGFVGFSWDLGTDQRREAEIAQARIATERNRLEIELELRDLETQVRSAQQAAHERLAALAAAETAVAQAEENLRIRRQQFDAGRASSEDVLDAQALLSAQRSVRASALYQGHVRLAELRSLMGVAAAAVPAAGGSTR